AERAFAELRALLATAPTPELVAPPGIRAQFYRRARLHAAAVAREPVPAEAALPYRTAAGAPLSAALLEAIRVDLPPSYRELLELRVLYGLEAPELAFVLDAPEAAVMGELDAAIAQLGRLRAAHPEAAEHDLARLVDDALSLCPSTQEPELQPQDTWEPLSYGTVVGGRYATARRVGSGA